MQRSTALLALSALLAAAPLQAQVAGLPVFNSGVNSGISLNADVGFPNADAGKGKTWAATGGVGLGPLGFTATLASRKPEGLDGQTWAGATANLKVFGGPLIPVSVNAQVGVGYGVVKDGSPVPGEDLKLLNVPVGLGIAVNIPTPGLSIKPWLAPRLQYMRSSGALDDSQTKFGLSAGVNLGLVGGINARVAYDYLKVDGGKPSTFSVGVGYNFNVPIVPGI
jgi:opacity protein-like surface antigen